MEKLDKNTDFSLFYNKSHRLVAAIIMVSNLMDENEELKSRIKETALEAISVSVNVKDINPTETKKALIGLEKNSLKLLSLIDIARISGLITKMNAEILRNELQIFITELNMFSGEANLNSDFFLKNVIAESNILETGPVFKNFENAFQSEKEDRKNGQKFYNNKNGGRSRKDVRKDMVLDFIKGHNDVSIKDIAPNIHGCSEKTIQRELIELINEGKIRKLGERRWSRYFVV